MRGILMVASRIALDLPLTLLNDIGIVFLIEASQNDYFSTNLLFVLTSFIRPVY